VRAAVALTLSLLVLSSAGHADACCALVGMGFRRVGAGLVSTAPPSFLLGLAPGVEFRGTAATLATLQLTSRGTSHPLAVDALAPGLLRVHASAAVPAGYYTVAGVASVLGVELGAQAATSALPAPQASSITTTRGPRGGSDTRALLSAPVPSSAVAVIISSPTAAIAWSAIAPSAIGRTEIIVANDSRCVDEPADYRVPPPGTVVTIRYVDASGALSPSSAAITVQ
jgi:hypothetical protein